LRTCGGSCWTSGAARISEKRGGVPYIATARKGGMRGAGSDDAFGIGEQREDQTSL